MQIHSFEFELDIQIFVYPLTPFVLVGTLEEALARLNPIFISKTFSLDIFFI
jgi:hypothetical protein